MGFSFKKFQDSDKDIHFYIGFVNFASFCKIMTFVLWQAEGMSNWTRKVYGTPHGTEADDSTGSDDVSNSCTDRALSQENQLFLTTTRLRLGVPLNHMANLFSISVPTTSRVFASWINLLFVCFGIPELLVA